MGPTRKHAILATACAAIAFIGTAWAAATGPTSIRQTPAARGTLLISSSDWPAYLHDTGHSSFNPSATSIKTGNIANVQPVWRWRVPTPPNGTSSTLWASPVVSNGVVYIGVEDGYFYAVSEATQQVLWSDFLGYSTKLTCPAIGITSTADVATDPVTGKPTVYVNGPDGNAYALDAATGAVVWKSVVGTPSTTVNDYYAWSTPLVSNGAVYVGISSNCDNPLVLGGVVAFNQATGAQIGKWLDQPATKKGGSVWDSPSVTASGRIIVGTGNGYGGSGQPLFDDTIAALDPNNLGVLDFWQIPPQQQTVDGDWGGSGTMFTASINGVTTPMVGMCNKNGVYYAFNQDNLKAGPIWQTQISVPYPGGSEECIAAAIWDGTRLIEGGGAPTTIGGTTYMGSVQALNPATGVPIWQTGLPGTVVGSPTEDGSGVVAAATLQSSTGTNGVYLLNAATGKILDFIPTPMSNLFGQPIFSGKDLLVGTGAAEGLTAYEITTQGPAITQVVPNVIGDSTTDTLTLTGSGFSGTPNVIVSGDGVFQSGPATVVSSTQLKIKLNVKANATQTPRNITVVEPGSPATTFTCSACLTIGPKPSPPTITSITPSSFVQGATHVPATVVGTNFDAGAVATSHAGVSLLTTFVNSTELGLSVSIKSTLPPGAYNLFVTDSDGLIAKCLGCITVTAHAAPRFNAARLKMRLAPLVYRMRP